MISRRTVLTASGAIAAASAAGINPTPAQAPQGIDLVKDWGFAPATPLPSGSVTATGLDGPRNEEVAVAFRLLFNAPRGKSPFDVAGYFEGLTERNKDSNPYIYEWPTPGRANPMIVGLFSMTNTLPSEGDQTSWCAAFVNFCLAVAGKKLTGSALSGSFRSYGIKTDDPKQGDIVVFRDAGPRGDQGFGHVGFVVARDNDGVLVLGGNQRGNTKSTGAVTRAKFPFDRPGGLSVHSYRTIV